MKRSLIILSALASLGASINTIAVEFVVRPIVEIAKDMALRAAWMIKVYHDKHYVLNVFDTIPSLSDLQQYNVNRPDQVEAIRSSLYDTLAYAQAGQTQLQFFQNPKGQNGKTIADTNMTSAGTLSSPQSFLVETIELYFFPTAVPSNLSAANTPALSAFIDDTYKFYKQGGALDFFIGSKSYLIEAPLLKFPPRCGLSGFTSSSDAASTGTASTSTGYASAGGPVYELNPPILLVPTQNFVVSLNWPTAVALSAAGTVMCQLGGILYRNSQ